MKGRVLMVAFEFPPCNGASVQRIFSVYQGFVEQGYEVDVLTAKIHAYEKTADDLLPLIAPAQQRHIIRTTALDASRHLGINGKYIAMLATPDRWAMTWIFSATRAGKKRIKKQAYDLIWSSAPMPSVHFIASKLVRYHREKHNTVVRWIADFRDPTPYMHSDKLPKTRKDVVECAFDQAALKHADMLTAATPGIIELYKKKYPKSLERLPTLVMKNGYLDSFMQTQQQWVNEHGNAHSLFSGKGKHLYYAGTLYADGRDPMPVFEALAQVNQTASTPITLHFQASGDGSEYRSYLKEMGLDRVVRFHRPVSLTQAVRNMLLADGLLLIQDEKFNQQIPGKLYEYLATDRPVVIKAPAHSLTAQEAMPFDGVWHGYSASEMTEALTQWLHHTAPITRAVQRFSRETTVRATIENIQQLD